MASNAAAATAEAPAQKALKVDDALYYLDQVKNEFPDRRIYDEFLKVMKDFRSGSLATPGVIEKVSGLFKSKPKLIIGFRKFLPAGYTIELSADDKELYDRIQGEENAKGPAPQDRHPVAKANNAQFDAPRATKPGAPGVPAQTARGMVPANGAPRFPPPAVNRTVAPARTGPISTTSNAANLELPHAISYVTKIKRRFTDDPNTYKAFLETLHGYQKQQKNINEVLDRVATLFADHPDLLRDFTYFLPDSVQEKARERMNRTVLEYEKRHGAAPPNVLRPSEYGARGPPVPVPSQGQYGQGQALHSGPKQGMGPMGGPPPGWAPPRGYGQGGMGMARPASQPPDSQMEYAGAVAAGVAGGYARRVAEDNEMSARERERERERERMVDRARDRAQLGMGPGRSARVQAVLRRRRAQAMEIEVLMTPTERTFFDRIRSALGPDAWVEFLKILELFSLDVLTKAELFMLVKELFHTQNAQNAPGYGATQAGGEDGAPVSGTKLLDEFKGILTNRATLEVTPQDLWYSMPVTEIDLSGAARCTPSYRALPRGWPKLSCSMRNKAESAVLNDLWVSVPTGSEGFSFIIMRKNQYEEALFFCEDARHEVDMVIENNAAAIRVLEPLAQEIEALKSVQPAMADWQFRLDSRSLGVMHLRAIARVYGEYGGEVLELLRKNPAGGIPIILARLRQKDSEWKANRVSLNVTWKETMAKNYLKSLDHRSFYFKAVDKKATGAKALLSELKGKSEAMATALQEWLAAEAEAEAEKARANATGASATAMTKAERVGEGKMEVEGEAVGEGAKPTPSIDPLLSSASNPRAPATSITASHLTGTLAEGKLLPRTLRAKLRSMEPVMHFLYRDTAVHADAYKLLQYTVEKSLPHGDKAPIAQLWRTFLGPFFRFPANLTMPPALAAYAHGYGAPDSRATSGLGMEASLVLQVGDAVATQFGEGIIADVRIGGLSEADAQEQAAKRAVSKGDDAMDGGQGAGNGSAGGKHLVYEVWLLPWGRAFMNPGSVRRAKSGSEVGVGVGASGRLRAQSAAVEGGLLSGILSGGAQPYVSAGSGKVPLTEWETLRAGKVKPTLTVPGSTSSASAPSTPATGGTYDASTPGGVTVNGVHYGLAPPPPAGSVFYATSTAYIFFRMHQYICDRLTTARLLCARGKARDSKALKNPLDRRSEASGAGRESSLMGTTAAAVAVAGGLQGAAREAAHHTGSSRASVAASHGDLTDIAAAAVGGSGVEGDGGEETYQAFLTALYGAIDGTMDPGKYEDECRDLMGTSAYLLFTLDKLCVSCAKQLQGIVHESASGKLVQHWLYAQARIALGVHKAATPAEAERTAGEALSSYRTAVGTVLSAIGCHRVESECYVVQYALTRHGEEPSSPTEDVISAVAAVAPSATVSAGGRLGPNGTVGHTEVSRAEAWAAPAHRTASLTLRFVGRPLADRAAGAAAVLPFEYAAALPAWLSRLLGTHPRRIVLGDEVPQIEEEDAEEPAKAAGAAEDLPPPPPKTTMGAMEEDL